MIASGLPSGIPSGPWYSIRTKEANLGEGVHVPKVIVNPPRLLIPVARQLPRTQNSPKELPNPSEMGRGMVTTCPSRLSQKSRPYLFGCNRRSGVSWRLWFAGTDKKPSLPESRDEKCWVGGLRSRPRTIGTMGFPEDKTVMFVGEVSSVR